jgi:hypothetical protein
MRRLVTSLLLVICLAVPFAAVAEDGWFMAVANDGGRPVLARVREQIPEGVTPADYPVLVGVVWEYFPSGNGLPSQSITARMETLEDMLTTEFESPKDAFLMVVVTGNGRREWQWYSRKPDIFLQRVKALAQDSRFPIVAGQQRDPSWTGYRRFQSVK